MFSGVFSGLVKKSRSDSDFRRGTAVPGIASLGIDAIPSTKAAQPLDITHGSGLAAISKRMKMAWSLILKNRYPLRSETRDREISARPGLPSRHWGL